MIWRSLISFEKTPASREAPAVAKPGAGDSIGIVFLHHRTDEVTANNLASFREWNPDTPIVTMSAAEPFPGGYSMRDFPRMAEIWERHGASAALRARSSDLLLYAWYLHRREHCDRWVIVEWDAFCAMTVEEYCAPTVQFPLVAPTTCWPNREPEWYWFRHTRSLPGDLHRFAAGLVPFCFILARDEVLHAVCDRVPWEQLGTCNGEVRFATLAHACGFPPAAHPLAGPSITWQPLPPETPLGPGMWHPVKWLAPRLSRPSASEKSDGREVLSND